MVALCCLLAPAEGVAAEPEQKRKAPKCANQRADVVGTEKSEVLKLNGRGHRVVVALGGADRILGSSRRDIICAGRGADRIVAQGGADRINAGTGADLIIAGGGGDAVSAGRGRDRMLGNGGKDVLNGSKDADVVLGGAGRDRILPGGAKDSAFGGRGNDLLLGARGDDRLAGGPDDDVVIGQIGVDRLRGGTGDDQLLGESDSDRINGGAGEDSIDGGSGPDLISAGGGSDRVRAGPGGDAVDAGDGEDLVLGGGGGDGIDGGRGTDRLYGDLVDDLIKGGPGDDLLAGGHGVDDIYGNAGDDWLRGDLNRDFHWGGTGNDTVSYATATPPGPYAGRDGVVVNLDDDKALEDAPQALIDEDEPEELVAEIENVVGSNYDDLLIGRLTGTANGLGGSDVCLAFLAPGCEIPGGPAPNVSMENVAADPGLLVTGGPGAQTDSLALSATDQAYVVTGNVDLTAGPGCSNSSPNVISCPKPATPLGYATVWGGDGPDVLTLAQGFPETAVILLDGGPGDDLVNGSSGSEILLAGPSGQDRLSGRGGDDALFSGPGADVLEGGDGGDQLVTNDPCGGHVFSGGPGAGDIAGFAQSIDHGVEAKIGGQAVGRGVSLCTATTVQADNEILEGTQHGDVLVGDNRDNALILGNEGNDVLIGKGGNDVLRGERGRDAFYGGGGADSLQAFDSVRDIALHCGPGGSEVIRDRFDPPGTSCGTVKKRGKGQKKGKRRGKRNGGRKK